MCGIFGLVVNGDVSYKTNLIRDTFTSLALLSESRGKDSSGFAFRDDERKSINVVRASMPISLLLKHHTVTSNLGNQLNNWKEKEDVATKKSFSVIGHSRLVTNGTQLNDENNQPVIKDGLVGVHNGIIINVDELWELMPNRKREYEIDTEVMFSLFRHYNETCNSSISSISKVCKKITGTVATGFFVDDKNELILATNNGSLYILSNHKDILFFASERYILESLIKKHDLNEKVTGCEIKQIKPNTGCCVDLGCFDIKHFRIHEEYPDTAGTMRTEAYSIELESVDNNTTSKSLLVDFTDIMASPIAKYEKELLEYNVNDLSKLRRCVKCVLPETFPFILYDEKGVCNYCNNYKLKNQPKPLDDLVRLVEPYRSKDGSYDCIVPFSGGRDSTFSLHVIKKILGLNPIAFTYDWGMVTDLARRNIARVCGKLGVENIIVAADITKKRSNIKKNIVAWLKRPSLGMIPLFMSGDKYFFYYTNQLKKQTGIKLNIWGINSLENTDFKTGFAGVEPSFNKKRIYSISMSGYLSFVKYLGENIALNPAYFNSSNLDSIGAIFSRYMFPQQDYYSLFDYYQWDEKEIENLILYDYDWEKAVDTNSTWRIGDGTASFYNYIYNTVAGFSENDTFRSNQIREGLISRQEALNLIEDENTPRYENIKWYLEIVGVDFESTIKTINEIPKLYVHNDSRAA